MMQIESKVLLDELMSISDKATAAARNFSTLTDAQLNYKPGAKQWSILECLEHLNLYGDYYLPEMERQMMRSESKGAATFHSGLLGNYFALSMQAKDGKIKKMKSPKDKEPGQSELGRQTIERFLSLQEQLKHLLQTAYHKDLNGIKVGISLCRFIRIRLGDTFRFYIYHIERHIAQAERNVR